MAFVAFCQFLSANLSCYKVHMYNLWRRLGTGNGTVTPSPTQFGAWRPELFLYPARKQLFPMHG